MPWQRDVAFLAGELVEHESGLLIPAFREVGFTVPRQSGKTTLFQAVAQQRAKGQPWQSVRARPQRMLYSAQSGRAAAEKLVEDWFPDFGRNRSLLGVSRFFRAMGKEGIRWANGSLLSLMTDDATSGHGKTLHVGFQDELFADTDDRRDQAMIPAMNTVLDAQVWKTSTAGTQASATWNTFVARGRRAAESGVTDGLCYVEFSADPSSDLDDPEVWATCMPALGHTISYEAVRHARTTLSASEFARAYLNIPVGAVADYVFGAGVWERGRVPEPVPLGRDMALGVEVDMSRDWAYVAAAVPWARDGVSGVLGDVIVQGEGTHWVVDEVAGLWQAHRCRVRIDRSGPASSFIGPLEARGVDVDKVGGEELRAACGGLFDAVTSSPVTFWHPPRSRLDDAATHLEKRASVDAFRWDRDAGVDPAPVVAVTVARHAVASTRRAATFTADDPGVS
jgi:hypothetical protein